MIVLLALAACSSAPLPTVEGLAPAEDVDDAKDVVEVHLTASRIGHSYDGETTTPTWAYNEQVPGPLIQARVGDTLRVVFTNELPDATTIHWHGLRIDNDMDGVPAVQDPVEPGEVFTYEFTVPEAGTFWYHPHVRGFEQVDRGLYGGLIVHEEEPPEVERDRYFMIDDVLLQADGRHEPFVTAGMQGVHGRNGNVLLTNGSSELLTGTIERGTVERWRVVNTSNARLMHVNVVGATWRVVGVDGGILEEPFHDGRVRLPVGRRFDLEVIADPDADTTELRVLIDNGDGFDRFPVYTATVSGESMAAAPLEWTSVPVPARLPTTQTIDIDFDAEPGPMGPRWMINGRQYDPGDPMPVQGDTPTLIRVTDSSGVVPGHPFHLHGQFFELVTRNGQASEVPGLLDTVHVDPEDTLELYTTFDNPGLWLGHCHILEHAELGMTTSFEVSMP